MLRSLRTASVHEQLDRKCPTFPMHSQLQWSGQQSASKEMQKGLEKLALTEEARSMWEPV